MNLISCDNCGVVLDAGKLEYPQGLDPSDPFDVDKMVWNSDRRGWVPAVPCPVCEAKIPSPDS